MALYNINVLESKPELLRGNLQINPKKGDYSVMVKVIDIFGNDTTHIFELQHR